MESILDHESKIAIVARYVIFTTYMHVLQYLSLFNTSLHSSLYISMQLDSAEQSVKEIRKSVNVV